MLQIDHVHFYVEDAQVWRDWFVNYLGFQAVVNSQFPVLSHQGSLSHTVTEVVKSGTVYFLLSSPLLPNSPVAEFLRQYKQGVRDVAFRVENVETAIALAQKNGATILQPIQDHLSYKFAKIAAWGSLTHTLIERHTVDIQSSFTNNHLFTAIDHVVLNVAVGDLKPAVSWYQNILDFQPQQAFQIKTEYSSLHSQVMISANGKVQLPINEPTSPNSQIQEFLEVNRGAGIQHIALHTIDLVSAIARFRSAGLSFLRVPQTYYTELQQRTKFPLSPQELRAIAQQEILVDWQKDAPLGALLLQIFTQPIFGEPTFFFEFIERRSQAVGFGEGNFRALFEAIEIEQIKRGFI
ncbi:4-hydroxyphenylpyruvate dioxygenase [Cronbergia sp. UHCC 0137]|uniref:4-hydroxyphenylpyruvate dioxygenase n=1 Tax=Cronbergia sp. UHCC 0137 TaxID=3110239 RepID=UPI002B20B701|nr:4-hydroxyphenylpyruvate dioxygenase [Cronbergia sp. UHCC 0137]MEA5619139.1 4-hydroxyphenylpyruvate dioxygenase [Cronbergia sp. UHCC 0137]